MSHKANDQLIDVIKDIALTPFDLKPEYQEHGRETETLKAGPNDWDNITAEDFGDNFDYEVFDHGSVQVLYPVCNAALQWCYRFLPEDCPRWGAQGFVIETRYLPAIVEGLSRDGLISEKDYVDNMNAEQELQNWQGSES